jgi:hypothetical protein
MDLHAIAKTPGFGSGKRARDRLAAEADLRAQLPPPERMLPVMASTDAAENWLICSFGHDEQSGADWHLTTDRVRGLDTCGMALAQDARADAETVAAILNAYRLGVLVVKGADQ